MSRATNFCLGFMCGLLLGWAAWAGAQNWQQHQWNQQQQQFDQNFERLQQQQERWQQEQYRQRHPC